MDGVGNSFSLPFKSPGWFGTFLVIGLITIIPVVGGINADGWMLAVLDNYRQGRTDLPPAGFYLRRGIRLWGVTAVYGFIFFAFVGVPYFLFFFIPLMSAGSEPPAIGPWAALLIPVVCLAVLLSLAFRAFFPAVVMVTERYGFAAGLDPRRTLALARPVLGNTIIAALLIYVAQVIAGFGIYACCVGIFVTLPYALAVNAAILRFYEYSLETAGMGTPLPPATPAV